jgi:hypothetical protein
MPKDLLGNLGEKDLKELLRKVDEAISDGQHLREKIVAAMVERRNPVWPETERRQKPRKYR